MLRIGTPALCISLRCVEQLRQAICVGANALPQVTDQPSTSYTVSDARQHHNTATTASTSGAGVQAAHYRSAGPCWTWRVGPHQHNGLPTPIGMRGLRTATKSASSPQAEEEEVELLTSDLYDQKARENLTPAAIVSALDKYIVGQEDAKRAVAIALRNRWRRSKLPGDTAEEIMPKNILMVGPTGCGKTEIARRLAKLADAPFIKVEATKYTELGFVGRDVEDIIKDLVEAAQSLVRQRLQKRAAEATAEKVERIILNALCGEHATADTWLSFRDLYRAGMLDGNTVQLELPPSNDSPSKRFNLSEGSIIYYEPSPGGGDIRTSLAGLKGDRGRKQTVKVAEARARLEEAEVERLMSSDQVTREAIRAAEQDGIVFIDEIDKIVEGPGRVHYTSAVSGSGVQRDLLPIIEGSTVQTKYGNVNTDHILFICAGAFHSSKPSDMLAELQGRLPIRVSLKALNHEDFYRILTEPEHNMIMQQQALLATEGVRLVFTDAAINAIARIAEQVNKSLDNIGARRLHTVLERILADVSFNAPERAEEAQRSGSAPHVCTIDDAQVMSVLQPLTAKKDLSRYVL